MAERQKAAPLARRPVRRTLQQAQKIAVTEPVRWIDRQGTSFEITVALARELFKSKYPFTDTELLTFLHYGRSMRANLIKRDMHLIKYAQGDPAQIVMGYHFFMAIAKEDPNYDNYDLWCVDAEGKRIKDGLETAENVVAAICEVYQKNKSRPVKFVARMREFNKRQAMWNVAAPLMLGKCAVGNAHRLADPGRMAGMYLEEEVGQDYVDAEVTEVAQDEAEAPAEADSRPEPEPETSEPGAEEAGPKSGPDPEPAPAEEKPKAESPKEKLIGRCLDVQAALMELGTEVKLPVESAEIGAWSAWFNRQSKELAKLREQGRLK